MDEASDLDIPAMRRGEYDVSKTKLYQIIYRFLYREKDKNESLIFFIPFPIVHTIGVSFFECTDYLDVIYESLKNEIELNCLKECSLYAILPTGNSNDEFLLRNLCERTREYITYSGLKNYFCYENYQDKHE
jgi:hypothetical protein